MRRVAAIDVGTNSVLLVVAEGPASYPRPVIEEATITRLGENVDRDRALSPRAVARTLSAIRQYAAAIERAGVDQVAVVGTSALRDAAGGREFCDEAEALLGTRPRVIGGLEEAELTFVGATSGLGVTGEVTVFDIGGGSTEIVTGSANGCHAGEFSLVTSLDLGSVRLTERCVATDPPTAAELEAARAMARDALSLIETPPPGSTLVGVAGTITTLAALDRRLQTYDSTVVHGARLARDRVGAIAEHLGGLTLDARRNIDGLDPRRADVIVCGAILASELFRWARAPELIVSDRGVRWGLVHRLLE